MEKVKKPIYKKWWFWLIIVILIAAAASAAHTSGEPSETPTASAPAQQSAPAQPSEEPPAGPSEEPSEGPSGEAGGVFHPGDTLSTDGLSITYQECDADWTGYNEYLGPQDGNKIVRASFLIENTGKSDRSCGSAQFDCYADGSACQAFYFSGDNDLPALTTISAGRNAKGYLYFEVPKDAQTIELEYEINMWTSEKAIFIIE